MPILAGFIVVLVIIVILYVLLAPFYSRLGGAVENKLKPFKTENEKQEEINSEQ
jgi:hypothetical protein